MYIKNKNKRLEIRVNEDLYNMLEFESHIRKCSISEVARSILLDWRLCKNQPNWWDDTKESASLVREKK